jgi:hypothetical protein
VQRTLAPLQAEGWRLRHSLPWQGRGDIDSVAIAPSGVAVAIETKTRTYDARHLDRVHEQAAWVVAASAKMVPPRRTSRSVPGPSAWRGTR